MSHITLWLIRHGQSSSNAGTWIADPQHAHLTPLGMEQAQNAAAAVTRQPDLIVMSPLQRARDSAGPIIQAWPNTPRAVWPIQELMYLSPQKLLQCSPEERAEKIEAYWQRADPDYCDGEDAESFRGFLTRIQSFFRALQPLSGFIICVGHGQFFKACELTMTHGMDATSEWMKHFREIEKSSPMHNSEIYRLKLTIEWLKKQFD